MNYFITKSYVFDFFLKKLSNNINLIKLSDNKYITIDNLITINITNYDIEILFNNISLRFTKDNYYYKKIIKNNIIVYFTNSVFQKKIINLNINKSIKYLSVDNYYSKFDLWDKIIIDNNTNIKYCFSRNIKSLYIIDNEDNYFDDFFIEFKKIKLDTKYYYKIINYTKKNKNKNKFLFNNKIHYLI